MPEKSPRKLTIAMSEEIADRLNFEASLAGLTTVEWVRQSLTSAIINDSARREAMAHFDKDPSTLEVGTYLSISDGHTVKDFAVDPLAFIKGTPYVELIREHPEE